nr:retrovirus-related Pol polyprotein from transposon TNT 1-94 [Tanacetum cinerariifolium]
TARHCTFTFYMDLGKKLSKHIDEFNKLIGNLANIDVDIDDEDRALMLLTSLPSSYDNFLETLLYGREYLTLEDVLSSLNLRELKKRTYAKDDGDGLYVRGRSDHRGNQGRGSSRSKSKACAIMGIGKVRVQMKDGSCFVLENIGRVKVIKCSLMVLLGTMKGNCVYSLDGWAESGEASVGIQEKESLAQVWHKRVGHIDEAGLHELEKREHTMDGVIDYVHADIWGPSRVESMSGCRKFKEWKKMMENQIGRKLKKLRTDNGLEFCNQEFNNLCKESGIAIHLTVAGTPQQNGLAERMNKTLFNKVRCLLILSGLPYSFWAEATVTTSYLINRSPSTTLEKETPNGFMVRTSGELRDVEDIWLYCLFTRESGEAQA